MRPIIKLALIVSIPTLIYMIFPILYFIFQIRPDIFALSALLLSLAIASIAFHTFPDDSTKEYLEFFIFRNAILITVSVSLSVVITYFLIVTKLLEFIRANQSLYQDGVPKSVIIAAFKEKGVDPESVSEYLKHLVVEGRLLMPDDGKYKVLRW